MLHVRDFASLAIKFRELLSRHLQASPLTERCATPRANELLRALLLKNKKSNYDGTLRMGLFI
jgi:hypothetical protein